MAHKHKLKFTHVGWFSSKYFKYLTWDFVCVSCPHTYRANRAQMCSMLLGDI